MVRSTLSPFTNIDCEHHAVHVEASKPRSPTESSLLTWLHDHSFTAMWNATFAPCVPDDSSSTGLQRKRFVRNLLIATRSLNTEQHGVYGVATPKWACLCVRLLDLPCRAPQRFLHSPLLDPSSPKHKRLNTIDNHQYRPFRSPDSKPLRPEQISFRHMIWGHGVLQGTLCSTSLASCSPHLASVSRSCYAALNMLTVFNLRRGSHTTHTAFPNASRYYCHRHPVRLTPFYSPRRQHFVAWPS